MSQQYKLFYDNIDYAGLTQVYYFSGVQSGFGLSKDLILYNGEIKEHTLSHVTLGNLDNINNIKNKVVPINAAQKYREIQESIDSVFDNSRTLL